jgi:hypothetical protein
MSMIRSACLALLTSIAAAAMLAPPASAQQAQKSNILVIMADDIGYWIFVTAFPEEGLRQRVLGAGSPVLTRPLRPTVRESRTDAGDAATCAPRPAPRAPQQRGPNVA